MFTLPPKPPKDFELKKVSNNQASASELTPSALPRATQTTLGRFCSPVPASDDEPAERSAIVDLSDVMLEKMADETKGSWIDKPQKNAFFLHDICKRYSAPRDEEYDPRFQHKQKVFQRSYKYETDCIENFRLKKLVDKSAKEEWEENRKLEELLKKNGEMLESTLTPCKTAAPFWWKEKNSEAGRVSTWNEMLSGKPEKTLYQTSYIRWQETPKLFDKSMTDPCMRREEFAKIGQPFKHEVCNWYFKNYPPPALKSVPKRLAK